MANVLVTQASQASSGTAKNYPFGSSLLKNRPSGMAFTYVTVAQQWLE